MRAALLFTILACLLCGACTTADEPLLIFAAASTRGALDEVLAAWDGPPVTVSYAASSTLARQIEAGAPASVFLSAHPRWMDHLEERGLLAAGTRRDLLANALVLVVPRGAPIPARILDIGEIDPLDWIGDGVFAMGDPDHVPVGMYGRAALEGLGWLEVLSSRIARGADARATLAFVERGEARLGVVYASDAAMSDRVSILAEIPAGLHPPITYPAAMVTGGESPTARALLDFLASEAAHEIFRRHGFREPS